MPAVPDAERTATAALIHAEAVAWTFMDRTTQIAQRSGLSPKAFDPIKAAAHPNPGVRSALAKHRDCPVPVLVFLAGDPIKGVRSRAVRNPAFPVEHFTEFADPRNLRYLLLHPGVPHDLFVQLLGCPDKPDQFLHWYRLSGNERHQLCVSAAQSLSCPPHVLRGLATTKPPIQILVAKNPNCPDDLLIELSRVDSRRVLEAAIRRPDFPVELVDEYARGHQNHQKYAAQRAHAALKNERCPPDTLRWAFDQPQQGLCDAAASNKNLPVALRELAAQRVPSSRAALQVAATTADRDLWERLSAHGNLKVQAAAAENPRSRRWERELTVT